MKTRALIPAVVAALVACGSAHADEAPGPSSLPGTLFNGMNLYEPPDDLVRTIGADEALQVAEEIAYMYQNAAWWHHEAVIRVIPQWDNPAWSVRAEISNGRNWTLYPRGGILTEHCTRDTMRWIVCHEMGHFFGGFPFHSAALPVENIDQTGTFASSEGTADYFATKDCLPRVWASDPNNAAFRYLVPEEGRAKCDQAWFFPAQRDICYRSIVVAKKAMLWIHQDVDITTPESSVASETIRGHFGAQCRFDTLVAGAQCGARNDLAVIPGLVPSPVTGLYGDHSVASEQQALPYACHGDHPGARPRCWFTPDMPDIVLHDCSGIPGEGMCDGDTVVTCTPRQGVQRFPCEQGCIMAEDPDGGQRYATCAEWE